MYQALEWFGFSKALKVLEIFGFGKDLEKFRGICKDLEIPKDESSNVP